MTHRQERGWVETAGKKLPGTVNERLAGAGDDALTRAFQSGNELAGGSRGDEETDSPPS